MRRAFEVVELAAATDHQNAAPIRNASTTDERNQQEEDVHACATCQPARRQRASATSAHPRATAARRSVRAGSCASRRNALPTTSSDDSDMPSAAASGDRRTQRGERNRDHVVGERPAEVLAHDAKRPPRDGGSRWRCASCRRRARRRRPSIASAPRRRRARSTLGLRERRRVVDAVADHRHDGAVRLQRGDAARLSSGDAAACVVDAGGSRTADGPRDRRTAARPQVQRAKRGDERRRAAHAACRRRRRDPAGALPARRRAIRRARPARGGPASAVPRPTPDARAGSARRRPLDAVTRHCTMSRARQ